MYISDKTIEKIRQIPVKNIISQYINVKDNKAICPFHNDTDPSLYINSDKNYFKCFGCDVGGDGIKFVELIEGVEFKEAVKKLSQKNNIKLKETSTLSKTVTGNFESFNLNDLMELINLIKKTKPDDSKLNESLLDKYNKYTHKYMLDLGFKKETLKHFEIGYCYDQNDELYNRITIPWRSVKGNLVAISGRDITDKSKNKYASKTGSNKKDHLYNLNNAKNYADEGIILVEDEKSVMRLYEFGYKNAVALGNCSLNDRKWLLGKHTRVAILAYDNDEAGDRERNKAIKGLLPLVKVYVVKLPVEYKDIAEIGNKDIWEEVYKQKDKIKGNL